MINFVGAGPGDPQLITLKGYRFLQEADLVIYTGSLINKEVLQYAKGGARLINSASLNLSQIIQEMVEAYQRGEIVVRLHTGDPSLYGAIGEQMKLLEEKGIPYNLVPGISSFLAAAASLKKEYTVPEKTQTLIITRMEGRTPVPEKENMALLASHRASMAVFLSAGLVDELQAQLLEEYPADTPVSVVYKASWPEEKIYSGELKDLAAITKQAGITKTALILVGEFLEESGLSKLYDDNFSHGYRIKRDGK